MGIMAAFHPSPAASLTDIQRSHTAEYVEQFVSGSLTKEAMRAIGFPWSQSIVARNLASVGGTLAATQALLQNPKLGITAHISGATHCQHAMPVAVTCHGRC
jgi:acetoin utilization deacetylase AcuC-like enzyme